MRDFLQARFRFWLSAVAMLFLQGCASITTGTGQTVLVETASVAERVSGAQCAVSNDKGAWTVVTPGSIDIKTSYQALSIKCSHEAFEPGAAVFDSKAKDMAYGNILIGGAIGAAIDITSGAAFQYPSILSVSLGRRLSASAMPVQRDRVEQPAPASLKSGDRLRWRIRDQLTGIAREAELRVDSASAEAIVFDGGERVEPAGGGEVSIRNALLGDMDALQPPGGWFRIGASLGNVWDVRYEARDGSPRSRMELTARVLRAESLSIQGEVLDALLVEYKGTAHRSGGTAFLPHPTTIRVWYSPRLKRVVRFQSTILGAGGSQPSNPSQEWTELIAFNPS
ncbi:MAG: hypothetical protein JNJ71_13405 [Rubrivivax sp.]|nr:hypothetical protein [Rubrivivax sp.]